MDLGQNHKNLRNLIPSKNQKLGHPRNAPVSIKCQVNPTYNKHLCSEEWNDGKCRSKNTIRNKGKNS